MPTEDAGSPRRVNCIPSGRLKNNYLETMRSYDDNYTRWKSAPFQVEQILNPYPNHYNPAFAFSIVPYPLLQQFPLRVPCPFRCSEGRRKIGLTTFPAMSTRLTYAATYWLGPVYPPMVSITTYFPPHGNI